MSRRDLAFLALALLGLFLAWRLGWLRTGGDPHAEGVALLRDSRFVEAKASFDKAIAADPGRAESYVRRGEARRSLADYNGAVEDFTRALELAPGDGEALLGRGLALLLRAASGLSPDRAADLGRALSDCEEALRVEPESAVVAHSVLASVHLERNEHDDAIRHATKAVELRPSDARSYANRAAAKFKKGDVKGARADHERAVAVGRDSDRDALVAVLIGRSIFRRNTDDAEGAEADSDEALRLDPESALAFLNRGLARLLQGRDAEAEADFRRGLALEKGLARALQGEVEQVREMRRLKGR